MQRLVAAIEALRTELSDRHAEVRAARREPGRAGDPGRRARRTCVAQLASERRRRRRARRRLCWAEATLHTIESHLRDLAPAPTAGADSLSQRLDALAATSRRMAAAMDFGFLFDPERKLLSIGYRVAEGSLDPSCYDLLASEARLASFVAIAKGDVPARHWFRLGRAVTPRRSRRGAGLLVGLDVRVPDAVAGDARAAGSLLEQTSRLVVDRQQAYGRKLGVPWGISESAYNARDLELTYQYSSFGVPGLGLKRGLGENTVVAPYATALAAMVDPHAAVAQLRAAGAASAARGRYGFYEALDYTRARLPEGEPFAIVRAYMAHHQGMTIVAIANTLLDGVMRERFHAEPSIQATELLLQERTPRDVAVARPRASTESGTLGVVRRRHADAAAYDRHAAPRDAAHAAAVERPLRRDAHGRRLRLQPLARSGGHALARPTSPATPGARTSSCATSTAARSGRPATSRAAIEPDAYEVTFSEHRAEFVRRDGDLTTTLDVVVSAEDDAEVRRVSRLEHGRSRPDHRAHVLCRARAGAARRRRGAPGVLQALRADRIRADDRRAPGDAAAALAAGAGGLGGASRGRRRRCRRAGRFETDRARFLGPRHGSCARRSR